MPSFTGSLTPNCQENSLPSSLKSLVSYIFNDPNLEDQDKHESQACLTVSQIILFNMKIGILILLLIPYLFHCPHKSLNSSSEIYPVFHW